MEHEPCPQAQLQTLGLRPGLPELDVEDLGAVGDGEADSTHVFEQAIDIIRKSGGGTISIPCGIFLSAPLQLTSHLTLFLRHGALLRAIDEIDSWPVTEPLESYGRGREGSKRVRRVAFISGSGLEDVVITGDFGVIDGNGWRWWDLKWGNGKPYFDGVTLPHLLEVRHSRHVEISRLKLVNSPFWTFHPFACKGVTVRDVEIRVPEAVVNTDGIDPDSCEDVLIENLVYSGGDDAVSIKSGWDCFGDHRGFNRPTRNVVIRNISVKTTGIAAAIAIGSEMSGGIEDVLIDGGRVERAGPSGGAFVIKTAASRGGFVRNITVRHLDVGDVQGPAIVVLHPNDFERNPACSSAPFSLPKVTDILVQDIRQLEGTTVGEPPVFLGAADGQAIVEGLQLQRVQLQPTAPAEPAPWTGMPACVGVKVSVNQVHFAGEPEPAHWLGSDFGCVVHAV